LKTISGITQLKELLKGKIYVLCHHNADPDAICAAYGIKELAKSLNPSVEVSIIVPGGVSKISREIVKVLGILTSNSYSLKEADVLIVVDTATLNQIDQYRE
jgi:nanoRNase/pAp phosphatase (c-di-AMP/oligoRNAs hydrolase)